MASQMSPDGSAGRFVATGNRLQHGDPLDRQSVRRALKSWNDSRELGGHPLACLNIVEARRLIAGYANSPAGCGIALREVLRDAIETLKPDAGDPNFQERRWRPYIIVKGQYVEGRYPDFLTDQLGIGRSMYHREQARALDILADILHRWEQGADVPDPMALGMTALSQDAVLQDGCEASFLAPLRPPYDLVGRDELLQDLKRQLLAGDNLALCALNGLPGVGKTALAIELTNDPDVRAHFRDGVLWAGLGRKPDVSALLGVWGVALGVSSHELAKLSSIEDRAWAIHAIIGTRRMLLVVDDAWKVGAALTFKVGGPACAHLLTTRIPEVALEFADGQATMVHELDEDDGLELLARLAPEAVAARPGDARKLVRAVGALPLALNLMGRHLRKKVHGGQPRRLHMALERLCCPEARLRLTGPQVVLERRPDLSAGAPLSLLTVIGISDEALDEAARCALRALSAFPPKPNSFSEDAALAVTAAPVEVLDALIDHGLLEGSEPGRYTLHQTIADYAHVKLADEAVYERLVTFFVCYVEAHKEDDDMLEIETENILAALEAAFEREMWADLVRGAGAFYPFLETRGLYAPAETLMDRAVQAAGALNNAAGLARMLCYLGRTMAKRGSYAQAEQCLQEGLALARQVKDQDGIVSLFEGLGEVAFHRGHYARADAFYEEGLALAREIGDDEKAIDLLMGMGRTLRPRGEYARAETLFQDGIALARKAGSREKMLALTSSMLTHIPADRGGFAGVEAALQEGLALAREVGDRPRMCVLLFGLGVVGGIYPGDYARAKACLEESLGVLRAMGSCERVRTILTYIGEVWAEAYLDEARPVNYKVGCYSRIGGLFTRRDTVAGYRGGYSEIVSIYQIGLTAARQIKHRERISLLLSIMGGLMAQRGDYVQAEAYLVEGLALAREIGHCQRIALLLSNLGAVATNCGDYVRAEGYCREGLALAREIGDWEKVGLLLSNLGITLANRRDFAQAESCLREGLVLVREKKHYHFTYLLLWNLGLVAISQGDYTQAETYLQEALAMVHGVGNRPRISLLLSKLGRTSAERGDHLLAEARFREALAVAREIEEASLISRVLCERGEVYLLQRELDAADVSFREALEVAREDSRKEWMGNALYSLACVAAMQGDVPEARRQGEESLILFERTGHRGTSKVTAWLETLPAAG